MSKRDNGYRVSMEQMEEVRQSNGCNTAEELFMKFGMPKGIKGSRAKNDFRSYFTALTSGSLANYQPPTYVVEGIKATLNRTKTSRRDKRREGKPRGRSGGQRQSAHAAYT